MLHLGQDVKPGSQVSFLYAGHVKERIVGYRTRTHMYPSFTLYFLPQRYGSYGLSYSIHVPERICVCPSRFLFFHGQMGS